MSSSHPPPNPSGSSSSSVNRSEPTGSTTRRWEDLNVDCLVDIFGRVGMESLLLDVPFVCKSWYRASLNPSCWERLIFPNIPTRDFDYLPVETESWGCVPLLERFVDGYRIDENCFSVTAFIKFVVSRSRGHVTVLKLPACTSETALKYVAEVCGDLKILVLHGDIVYNKSSIFSELIGKWKHLESLILGSSYDLVKILSQISIDCKDFSGLRVSNACIGKDEAMAIVSFLPKLKRLVLRKAKIDRAGLITLLRGCKELLVLDVSNSVGFSESDEEISKLASHISKFSCEGCIVDDYDYDDDCYDSSFMFDEVVYDGYYSN